MLPNLELPQKTFVGRSIELQKLQYYLGLASQNIPQICFIAGEAGSGKSTLVQKFLSESEKQNDNLIFAIGECSGQVGVFEPYLSFKILIQSFIKLLDKAKDKKQESLKKFARLSAQTIIEVAPDLIGNLIPGGLLISKGLDILIEKTNIKNEILADKATKNFFELQDNQISQQEICQQYTSFLHEISKNYIVVLVIEDLHWADQSSINLLFHITRYLKEGHILILGTYRPEDIKIRHDEIRHPLESVLNEIKRYRGDVGVDLNQITTEKRIEFINSLIDTEPNDLQKGFRDKFFELTEGNALFTTELLYYMKENEYLQINSENKWVVNKDFTWDHIPSRVEAVIKERVDRLNDELKKTLTIASVEGENFTAQVVGRLEEVNDRLILNRLSSQLAKRHHLIEEDLISEVSTKNDLAFFKFSHSLIQQYIYNEIGAAEKRILHKGIAEALENLYGEDAHMVSSQLAKHYEEARMMEKAVTYYIMAGNKSLQISAFREAKIFFEHALSFEVTKERGTLLRKIGIAYYGLGLLEKAKLSFEQSININQIENPLLAAESEAWLGRVLVDFGDFHLAKDIIEHGLASAESSNNELFAHLLNELAYVNMSLEFLDIAENLNRKSLEICENNGYSSLLAKVLYDLGCCLHIKGDFSEATAILNKGINIAQNTKSKSIEAYCHNELGWINYDIQKFDVSLTAFSMGLSIAKNIDNKWLICESLNGLGFCNCAENNSQVAEALLKESLEIGHEIEGMTETLLVLVGFANLYLKRDEIIKACELIDIALNHPSSDYEIKYFARKTLANIKELNIINVAEGKISNIDDRYEETVKNILDTKQSDNSFVE
jgi:tetratricopeptide (TPR) repeat protein/GTPase SAR1 family protein